MSLQVRTRANNKSKGPFASHLVRFPYDVCIAVVCFHCNGHVFLKQQMEQRVWTAVRPIGDVIFFGVLKL